MKILIAVSGGVDSVVLLDLLTKKKLEKFTNTISPFSFSDKLAIAHFSHKIHSLSDVHTKFVEKLAMEYSLDFFSEQARTELKSEAAARETRYRFLGKIAEKIGAGTIALAHHADDQAETIFLNLIRGAGLAGLSGMREISKISTFAKTNLWRPLLRLPKNKIEKYAQQQNLKFVRDPTNMDKKYARNFLRHEILPQLVKLNPKINESFLRVAARARECSNFLENFAASFILKNKVKKSFSLKKFNSLEKVLACEVLRKIYLSEVGNLQKIEEKHFLEVLALATNPHGGKRKKFGVLEFRVARNANVRVLSWGKSSNTKQK